MKEDPRARRMRALLLASLLAALALAGCAREGPEVDPECGGLVASPWSDEGAFVKVQVLYDLDRSAGVCVQFDDGPILAKRVAPTDWTPHVVDMGEGRLAQPDVRVGAWLIGQDLQASASFVLAEENYFVIHVDAEERISIQRFDEPPRFE